MGIFSESRVTVYQWGGQLLFYLCLFTLVGYFSDSPVYQYNDAESAELELAVRFSGTRLGVCETLTAADVAELAPNMKVALVCPREKSPLSLRLYVNEDLLLAERLLPSGIHGDGVIASYKRLVLEPGTWDLRIEVDSNNQESVLEHEFEQTIETHAADSWLLSFGDDGFKLKGG